MRRSTGVATVAAFTALILSSDFALAGAVDVKLLDTVVFLASLLFGLRYGIAVAVLSETVWSFVSPWGVAGVMAPFLVGGELLFVLAGWGAARAWGTEIRQGTAKAVFIGATMAICAFLWDFETNAATALFEFWPHPSLSQLVAVEILQGGPFFLAHDISDFLLGMLLIPVAIPVILRVYGGRV
ncbi:MAG TPA: hypothetical protein VLY21_03640 [Nitrososphaerales archaeon]|nr:hypothetical protein [Nitrososphaerales archaeon]